MPRTSHNPGLFAEPEERTLTAGATDKSSPLAERMRPRTRGEYIGQEHIVGEGKLLRRAIQSDRLFSSIILWGPPGTGKTTLAQVIANTTKSHFVTISAILAGKADLRVIIAEALERRRLHNIRAVSYE